MSRALTELLPDRTTLLLCATCHQLNVGADQCPNCGAKHNNVSAVYSRTPSPAQPDTPTIYDSHDKPELEGRQEGEYKVYDLAPAQPEWLPIESAPKDGRALLLGYPNRSGKWRTVRGQWFTNEEIAEWEEPDDFEAGWYETSEANDDPPNCWPINPTHWMPLPQPPKGDDQQ